MNRFYKTCLLLPLFAFISILTPAQAAQSTLLGLSISGTQIVADGKPVRLRGVNMGDPFWARNPDWYNYSITDYDTLSNEWRTNIVRISIFPTQWKNMDHNTLMSGLSQEINAALNSGMYVIISYHVIGWPDGYYKEAFPGNPQDTYDSSMSVATSFWSAMAQAYGSDPRIIFDLWNEPVHPDDFTLYGSDPNPLWPILKSYYETLIQTVRGHGAQNILIATGNRWASWLVGIKDDPLSDPNIIYGYHQYSVEGSNTPTEWNKNTGGLVGLKPVIVTEWGYEDTDVTNPTWPGSQASYGNAFTQWLESHGLSSLAWMYHHDWTPALLKPDGNRTLYGDFAKQYISSLNSIQFAVPPLDPSLISFREVATGLSNPVFITNAGDASGRMFIVELTGRIRLIKNGILQTTPFLDIHTIVKSTGGEQGLLALAFHPNYETNHKFYVAYTAPRNGDSTGSNLVLERFSASANDPDQADPNSGVIVLTISHPNYSNHNGGTLAFGPDGYLYWSTGDGGGGGDPDLNAQNLNRLLGKILRLDVDSGSPYGIPASNPFYSSVDPNIKKEIWAYGLRNPWRLSFDRLTHDLYIGDVGQGNREEVDYQPVNSSGGENYGWNIMEGSTCYNANTCNQTGKVLPVAEYDHTLGCSITGGYVYRGINFPSLYGHYFYGDYCSGRLFGIYNNLPTGWDPAVQLADTPYNISTFGEDENGELYLADLSTGKIYKIGYKTFTDVPLDYWAWEYIERLYDAGITSGCGTNPLTYCPTTTVTRDQMAVFLLKGKHSSSYVPPTATGVFQDVPTDYWAAAWIEQLAAEGITAGCGNNNYCPTTAVTRDQMAVFLLKAKHGSGYVPPTPTGVFLDVPTDYWAAGWIEQLAAEGITAGCGNNNYCPTTPVTRDQMAVFLVKNFNLP